jgi:hypothetical protein
VQKKVLSVNISRGHHPSESKLLTAKRAPTHAKLGSFAAPSERLEASANSSNVSSVVEISTHPLQRAAHVGSYVELNRKALHRPEHKTDRAALHEQLSYHNRDSRTSPHANDYMQPSPHPTWR